MALNVLFLHTGGSWIRGSENALLTIMRGVDREKIQPFLCTSNNKLALLARAEGIETMVCRMPEIMVDGSSVQLPFLQSAMAIRTICSFAKQMKIQLLYCNGGSTCQIGYYAGKLAGIPVVSHLHSPYNRRYILLYRLHRAAKVIVVSKAVEKAVLGKQRFLGNCEVVYNGVDLNRFQPARERNGNWRKRLGLPAEGVVFGQVSSLIPRKGIDVLLRAFQIVSASSPDSRLVLVGDGPQHSEYSTMVRQLRLSGKVLFTGNQDDPLPYYQQVFDVNVLASRSDAFPLSLLEAAACGLPCIGADVDGIGEAVQDSQTGLLFESGKPELLAEKMLLLVSEPLLRKAYGIAGRQQATERFSMDRYCKSIQRIILEYAGAEVASQPFRIRSFPEPD